MGMEFESKKYTAGTSEAEIAKLKAEQATVLTENTRRIKDLQNIVADMVEGGEA